MNDKVYIHEFIDIIGPNRARYMHHMTANWCPVARAERNQLCFGVWGTVGSTGRWPEVVNLWELDGWDGLVGNFSHELSHDSLQDPSLAQWWGVAADLRRGGVDRIVVPEPWTEPIEALTARGVRGEVYAHELFSCAAGAVAVGARAPGRDGPAGRHRARPHLRGRLRRGHGERSRVPGHLGPARLGHLGRPTSRPGSPAAPCGRGPSGWPPRRWRVSRTLLVDAPLAPLRLGRQPLASDRRPLDQL